MSVLYSKQFYEKSLGVDYSDREYWSTFFGGIAKKIVEEFNPKTVLDAGCASGYLVEALRELGVEAYGVDISEYAINSAREDIRDFMHAQSITDDLPKAFPKRYDLVVTIEVLEHMYPEDGKKAIEKLCSYSDIIIFTSTPYDLDNKTHVNVQQREYWVELFARNSFYRDLVTRVDFICAHAMLFKKGEDVARVLFEYELSNRVDELRRQEKKEETKEKEEVFKCYYLLEGQAHYSEEFCKSIYYTGKLGNFTVEINGPKRVTALRIDPMESNCMIKHFHVYDLLDARDEIVVKQMNGIENGNKIIFESNDPMFEMEVPQNNGMVRLEVCFEIEHADNEAIPSIYHMVSGAKKHIERMERGHQAEIGELAEEVAGLKETCDVLRQEKWAAEQVMEKLEKQKEEELEMLAEDLIKKLDGYKEAEQKIKEMYEESLRKLNAEQEELEKEKKSALLEQVETAKEKEVLAARLEEIVRQKKDAEEAFQVEKNKFEQEMTGLKAEIEHLRQSKYEMEEKLRKEKAELYSEICEESILKLKETYAELEKEKKNALQEQVDAIKEKEKLAVKLEEAVRQKKEAETYFQTEQDKLVAEIDKLKEKMEHLHESKCEMVEKFHEEKAEICFENEILKQHLDSTEKEKKALEQKIAKEYETEKDSLCKKIGEKEKEVEKNSKALSEIKIKYTEVQKKLEASVLNYDTAIDKQKELQAELDHYMLHYHTAMNQRTELQAELDHYMLHYQTAINQREELIAKNNVLQRQRDEYELHYNNALNSYLAVTSSTCWKITSPLRKFLDFVRGEKKQESVPITSLFDTKELEKQRNTVFSKEIKFSILVPLYNTPLNFLNEMIGSVVEQTYANWELCLADGSDDSHRNVKSEVQKLVKKDKRIKYKKLKENKGISENTNECIEMATGDYIVLFDHDDVLHPSALYEVMKAICEKNADFIYTDENTFSDKIENAYWPHYKPDYSPDTLRSYNYICHLSVFKRALLKKAGGGFRKEFDGSQDYDMVLRLTEAAECIVHIPKVLYYWRAHKNSVASDISAKPYTLTAAKKALAEHLDRVGLKGEVCDAKIPSTYQIKYEIKGKPLVSIIIPNKDHIDDLDKCIQSVEKKSTYKNFEIIVVENNSTEKETAEYYRKIQKKYKNIRVVTWREGFNYSKINNFGFKYAKGEYIVLLNNDIEILTPDWLEQMLMYTQRKDVGAAGMMLYYPDDTIQHAGVILGIGGVAGHSHKYFKRGDYGYASRLCIAQNLSAVTAASMMIRSDVYKQIGGLDEGFAVAFNDVDLCMKIREAGYLIVWTPYAEAYHYESKSRGFEDTPEKQERFKGEIDRFMDKWGETLEQGDPYYNPNLTLTEENFSINDKR